MKRARKFLYFFALSLNDFRLTNNNNTLVTRQQLCPDYKTSFTVVLSSVAISCMALTLLSGNFGGLPQSIPPHPALVP